MKNIWTIVKKELARVFTDKGMIFSLFILPPLMIYLIYGLMGMGAERESDKAQKYIASVYVVNSPEQFNIQDSVIPSFNNFLDALKTDEDYTKTYKDSFVITANVSYTDDSEIEDYLDKLENEEID